MVFPTIFVLFIAMPILEIFVLIQVGGAIGALPTIAIVILTAIVGTWMLRAQGLSTVNKACLLYTSPSPRDRQKSRMPSSA